MQIEVSYPTSDEFKFIIDSWSSSFRKSKFAGVIPNNLWMETQRATISQIMLREQCDILLAIAPRTSEEQPRRIMGYIVGEPGILHWVYTKKDFRRLGIGSSLLQELLSKWPRTQRAHPRFTHRTDSSYRFLDRSWKWDPIPARVKA